jgi:hypothetical protein
MKRHSTNYFNTFIKVAEDCPVDKAEIPPEKQPKSAVRKEYELLCENPYKYTSDEVLLLTKGQGQSAEEFFSKGRPCFRTSALTKRYGWGIHCDDSGRMAIFAAESPEYDKFIRDTSLKVITAARNKRR